MTTLEFYTQISGIKLFLNEVSDYFRNVFFKIKKSFITILPEL